MKWLDTIREMAVELWITPRLKEHFPGGIPAEAMQAVMSDIERVLAGEPVNWFELRRLILSVTNEALLKLEEAL